MGNLKHAVSHKARAEMVSRSKKQNTGGNEKKEGLKKMTKIRTHSSGNFKMNHVRTGERGEEGL